MTDTAILEQNLADAETALHKVMIGQSVTVVSYDGHRTEFTPAMESQLRRYINSLKRQLGQGAGAGSRTVVF
ncbi:gpW family head-tail joining protein [Roseivivax sp. THAF197b]|uniref:gpW family head-tail joining protein n=1 Tax=Roseivivax sp. THAF197b TaxID=2588299 RepID=UPI00126863A2|nr:gpW family head-tail joining protein [Roseivivax sp. THAF197b]QFS83992.1 gpW [Roseivivax sp. THAF197b]